MKKASLVIIAVTLVFVAFAVGFFLGRSTSPSPISVSNLPTDATTEPPTTDPQPTEEEVSFPIDVNTATVEDLTALPGIGQTLAQRIVAYRNEKGSFKSLSELLNVDGIGEKTLENILQYITIGGQS